MTAHCWESLNCTVCCSSEKVCANSFPSFLPPFLHPLLLFLPPPLLFYPSFPSFLLFFFSPLPSPLLFYISFLISFLSPLPSSSSSLSPSPTPFQPYFPSSFLISFLSPLLFSSSFLPFLRITFLYFPLFFSIRYFAVPVDQAMLSNYSVYVRNPIDLSTIRARLGEDI